MDSQNNRIIFSEGSILRNIVDKLEEIVFKYNIEKEYKLFIPWIERIISEMGLLSRLKLTLIEFDELLKKL